MRRTIALFGSFLLIASCNLVQDRGSETQIPPLFERPGKAFVNTGEGYLIHPLTGDSIQAILDSRGDTIVTGKPVPIIGRLADGQSVQTPVRVKAGSPDAVPLDLQIHPVPGTASVRPIPFGDLFQPLHPESPDRDFHLVNQTGDTIPTGIPLELTGSQKIYMQKFPDPALPPAMKDQATEDLAYLDTYHGLFASQVISLLEDRRSRIWMGTTGGGASLYNGIDFIHLTEEEGLCESWILCILEDRQGNIWFGSNGEGLIRFDGSVFTHFTPREGLNDDVINALAQDRQGIIWIGTQEGGLSRFDGTSFTHITTREGLPANRILAIHADRHDRLWIGLEEGICIYEGDSVRHLGGFGIHGVTTIMEDSRGRLWIGSNREGLYGYHSDSLYHFTAAEGLLSSTINSVLEGPDGDIWMTTTLGGAARFDGQSFQHYTTDQGIAGNWLVPMLLDHQENMWMGAIGGGLSIYRDRSFRHYREQQGLSSRAVYSIAEDSEGNLWFGTMFRGVCKFDGMSFYQYSSAHGLPGATVEAILEDSEGNLWFGSSTGGVTRFDGQYFTTYGQREGFTNSPVGSIMEDGQGNIWFGTFGGGAIRFDGSKFMHFTTLEGMITDLVEVVFEDSRGDIWMGTLGGGVTRYDGESMLHYTRREGLGSDYISSIYEDSRGLLWIGTMTAGVTLLDGENFTYITEGAGLNDNMIRSIIEDGDGQIWLSTDQGINLLTMNEEGDLRQVHSFGLEDGLKGLSFLQNSVLIDNHQRIWWGNNKALTMLDLDGFKMASEPPDLQLDRVDINGWFIDYRSKNTFLPGAVRFDSVASFRNYPHQLRLPCRWNHLTFHFSATDWEAPHKIRYTYKMEGPRSSWSLPSTEPFADYRNLSFGTHTFLVRALGESQQWSDPVSFTFTVLPPWYHTWWARASYAVLGILIILAYARWRTHSLKKRQAELESTVKDRTREISEQREELQQQNENLAAQQRMIERQNRSLTDSIEYAKRIQSATLPPDEVIKYLIPKHFVLYRPLQIVSGDFYWLTQKQGKILLAVADCTGHGVPGAFMSMLGSALLNDIAGQSDISKASTILDELRDQVILSLRQTGAIDEARDGLDIGLCILDMEKMSLQYAGAHHPLYLVRNGRLQTYKGDPMPIGISAEAGRLFTNQPIEIQKGDTLYLFTDGYVDQLGGEKRKRYTTARFRQLLLDNQERIMLDQKKILEEELDRWMGITGLFDNRYEQIDDILVLGIRI